MINKVLAIILYISGIVDSKSIVKEVVWRKQQNKGGRLLIQGGDYIYIYIYTYIYIYIYIYMHACIHTYIHACIHACINLSIYIYIHTYVQ